MLNQLLIEDNEYEYTPRGFGERVRGWETEGGGGE